MTDQKNFLYALYSQFMAFDRLACWTLKNHLNLLPYLSSSGFTMGNVAPGQNSLCDQSYLSIGNNKALSSIGEAALLTPAGAQPALQLSGGNYRWELRTESPGASHAPMHTCIPSPGIAWSPLYQGASVRHFQAPPPRPHYQGGLVEAVLPFVA